MQKLSLRASALLGTAMASGLLCASVAAQVTRSNSLSHTQNPTANTATATCAIAVDEIDHRLSYTGNVQIFFTGPADNTTRLLNVTYVVGPAAQTFVDESPGVYRVVAKLAGPHMSVTAEATRGPLGYQISNQFVCNASIGYVGVTTDYLHAFTGVDNFYGYGSTP